MKRIRIVISIRRKEVIVMRTDPTHGLPRCERGYVSGNMKPEDLVLPKRTVWHGKHKPYCCDFPPELLKR